MKIEIVETLDGGTVKRLIPENDADRAKLEKMAKEGKLDVGGSFGDEFWDEDDDQEPGKNNGP